MLGDSTGELDRLEPALHLAPGVGLRLAVLARDDPGDLVRGAFEQTAEAEHDLRASREGGVTPIGKRTRGGSDRGIRLLCAGEGDARSLLPGGRVEYRPAPAGLTVPGLSVDPVGDLVRHRVPLLALA
jgi:hypothetical protein